MQGQAGPSWQDGSDVWMLTPTLVRFLGRVQKLFWQRSRRSVTAEALRALSRLGQELLHETLGLPTSWNISPLFVLCSISSIFESALHADRNRGNTRGVMTNTTRDEVLESMAQYTSVWKVLVAELPGADLEDKPRCFRDSARWKALPRSGGNKAQCTKKRIRGSGSPARFAIGTRLHRLLPDDPTCVRRRVPGVSQSGLSQDRQHSGLQAFRMIAVRRSRSSFTPKW